MDQINFNNFDDIGEIEEIEDYEYLEGLEEEGPPKEKKQRKLKREKKERVTKFRPKKRKKAFSGQTVLGLGCILAALLIFFVIEPLMSGVIGNQIEIARVSTTIFPGEKITTEKIETVKVNSGSIPSGAVIKNEDIVGKFSDSKMVEGEFFMSSKLKDTAFGDGIYLNGLDGSKRILSITAPDFATGLSAKIKAGDIITILAPSIDGKLKAEAFPELKYIKVLAVTLATGVDGTEGENGTSELPASITVLANDLQAELLVGLNSVNRIHTVLAYRGNQEKANEFLEKQEAYFQSGVNQ